MEVLTTIANSIEKLRNHPDIIDKRHITQTYEHLGTTVKNSCYIQGKPTNIRLGDDAAAIPQEDGSHLLVASEGIVSRFLEKDPWFAGYSAIMVNISDICAMGGLPLAVTDTLYTYSAEDSKAVWEGMLAASEAYGVPIVGGHTCYHSEFEALSVAILGKATAHLLTSFDAKPDEELLLVMDLNGSYYKEYPFWNASTTTPSKILRERVSLLHIVANAELSLAAKDVSMGGIIGTLLMLMNTSKVGAELWLDQITKPEGITWEKWLSSFPSYGYLLTCTKENSLTIQNIFEEKQISCETVGRITKTKELWIHHEDRKIKF